MKYTLKKRFFAPVLLNSEGQKLNLKNSPFSIKKINEHFVLEINNEIVSPTLRSIEHTEDLTLGTTENYEKCKIDLQTGKVSKPYLRQIGKHYILPNGEIVKFNNNLESFATNFSAVITFEDKFKLPGNMYGKIVIKNKKTNLYGVMDENGKIVCPCKFISPNIWFNFEVVKQTPNEITDPLQLHKVDSLSCYTANLQTKLFDGNIEVPFKTTKDQSIFKLGETKNEVILSVYDSSSDYSRIFTYNFLTKQMQGKALLKGFAVKYEKINGDVMYGATRQKNNKLILVDFIGKPISSEQYDTIEFATLNKKTVAIVSKNNKYGIFDIRNREYIVDLVKSYSDVNDFVKNNGQENIK